jgi:HEAT repeat protein
MRSPGRGGVRTFANVRPLPPGGDLDAWVGLLGSNQRRRLAKAHLLRAGADAVPAIRRGLHHRDPTVRLGCVNLLDQLVDDDAVPDLVAALDDDDPAVVGRALHALACDACKQNECRPTDDLFLPRAIELMRHPDPDVRARAIDTVGRVARRGAAVLGVLEEAATSDPDRGLRGMARHLLEQAARVSR